MPGNTLERYLAERFLPESFRHWIRTQQRRWRLQRVRVGTVEMGTLRRRTPISRAFGIDRGQPIVRFYIERHFGRYAEDIAGRVLEIGDDRYTRMFGAGRVTRGDVLHVVPGTPGATIIADLTKADHLASDQFDCIICAQTLQMIFEIRAAVAALHRLLRPGGVLLITSSGIGPIGRREGVDPWGEYWFPTGQGMRRLLGEFFGFDEVEVETYGNVLSAISFLHGLATEELAEEELEYRDPDYELIVGARARKA